MLHYIGDRRMKKPKWLKKAHPNKPWKYKHTICEGKHKGLVIEPYNFHTPIGMDCGKIDEAIEWIDWEMKIKKAKKIIKEVRTKYEV